MYSNLYCCYWRPGCWISVVCPTTILWVGSRERRPWRGRRGRRRKKVCMLPTPCCTLSEKSKSRWWRMEVSAQCELILSAQPITCIILIPGPTIKGYLKKLSREGDAHLPCPLTTLGMNPGGLLSAFQRLVTQMCLRTSPLEISLETQVGADQG